MACTAFLDKLSITSANRHRMHGEASDPEAAAHDYENEIKRHFGLGPESQPRPRAGRAQRGNPQLVDEK